LTRSGNKTDFKFNPDQKKRKHTDVQGFTKVFYKRHFIKPTRSKWHKTYREYYRRRSAPNVDDPDDGEMHHDAGEMHPDAEEMEVERDPVSESIRLDIQDELLDVTVEAVPSFEVDDGEEEEEDGEDDGEEQLDDVNVPKVPLWYVNAVMKKAWEGASQSQRDAVEKYKKAAITDDEMELEAVEGEDNERKVTRLKSLLRFVLSYYSYYLPR
jgi:hypothetical protein